MTIHAYHEIYVNKVQTRLGIAFDYAINVCLIPGEEFTELFCRSQVCRSLERGESRYALGKSGIEILVDVIEETTGRAPEIKPECRFFRTKEHWIGWTAAYCQWYTDRSFRELFTSIPYSDFEKMYTTLHEADISKFMDKLGMDEDEPITAKMITRSIEKAQKKVESHNFEIRKYVLEYDDVMNQQREVLYGQRRQVLTADSLRDTIMGMVDDIIHDGLDKYADEKLYPEEWDFAGLLAQMQQYFVPKNATTVEELENLSRVEVQDKLKQIAVDLYDERLKEIGETTMKELEKAIMLRVVDSKWMDHLDAMDALKEGINLRAYGQKNPLVEYKFEAYEMFEEMIDSIKRTVVTFLYHIQVTYSKPVPQAEDHLQGAHEVHEESKPVSAEDIKRDEEREKQ